MGTSNGEPVAKGTSSLADAEHELTLALAEATNARNRERVYAMARLDAARRAVREARRAHDRQGA